MTKARKSFLPAEFHGVCDVSGPFGVGKSYFLSESDFPGNIAYFDYDDGKAQGLHKMLKFVNLFENLEQDRYTVAIIDDASRLMAACKVMVQRRAAKYAELYGIPEKFIQRDTKGNARGIVNQLISTLTGMLHLRGVHLVAVSHHLGAMYSSGGVEIPNKYRVKGYRSWQQASILTVILVPGDHPPTPSGIVRKEQLGSITIDSDPSPEELELMRLGEAGHDIARRLPERLPKATMQEIRRYLAKPANLKEPAEGEALVLEETEPYLRKLSAEQIAFVHVGLRIKAAELEDEAAILGRGSKPFARDMAIETEQAQAKESMTEKAKAMQEEGKTPKEIATELEMPLARVKRMLK
jgi:hypothetical protein